MIQSIIGDGAAGTFIVQRNVDENPISIGNFGDASTFHRQKTEDQIKAIELMDTIQPFIPVTNSNLDDQA